MKPTESKPEAPAAESGASTLLKATAEREREIGAMRQISQAQYDEWQAMKVEREVLGLPAVPQRAIISKPLPANYVVYVGTLPPSHVELRMAAKGRVEMIPDGKQYVSTGGRGGGKPKLIRDTTNAGLTGRYLDAGYTDIHFEHRCPPGHKFAGRPWAEIQCPEHAAWLQLTRGKDRDGNRMFVFHLTPEYTTRYTQLRDSNMRKLKEQDRDIETILTQGEPMPEPALAGRG